MNAREPDHNQMLWDVIIVGGGINGAVAAAALSSSGLKVALLEKHDFASSTSQESSNLVWGGIKYLESYEFSLVWNLCRSRNELARCYPSSLEEMRFFTHLEKGFRKPRLLVFLGSLLYWLMGRCFTRAPRLLSQQDIAKREPLVNTDHSLGGLEYSDCYLKDNDARFVFQFIQKARSLGALAKNYHPIIKAERRAQGEWHIQGKDLQTGKESSWRAKVLINATGPYADGLNQKLAIESQHRHIFSKGVHLIVRRLNQSQRVLTFFADDGRLFFVIPMGHCSCIGTTDTRVQEIPPQVTDEDRTFILSNINKRLKLKEALTRDDIIAERCGVRPLVVRGHHQDIEQEEWLNLSRKHVIEWDRGLGHISIFGGKLTDCLNIGRELQQLMPKMGLTLPKTQVWYGEADDSQREQFYQAARSFPILEKAWLGEGTGYERLWRLYGPEAHSILKAIHNDASLAQLLVEDAPVLLAEVAYMKDQELIIQLEDFLRRRTRLSLTVTLSQLQKSQNLKRACEILFGEKAEEQWSQYFIKAKASQVS